jgi:hypothetical protein
MASREERAESKENKESMSALSASFNGVSSGFLSVGRKENIPTWLFLVLSCLVWRNLSYSYLG